MQPVRVNFMWLDMSVLAVFFQGCLRQEDVFVVGKKNIFVPLI